MRRGQKVVRTPKKSARRTLKARVARPVPQKVQDDTAEIIAMLGGDVQRFSGKTVLLSGGAGFLGRHITALVKRLNAEVLSAPCTLISVDNFITGDQEAHQSAGSGDSHIRSVWADVTYPLPLRQDLDFIIHAAGVASPVYYMKHPIETIESAVHGGDRFGVIRFAVTDRHAHATETERRNVGTVFAESAFLHCRPLTLPSPPL